MEMRHSEKTDYELLDALEAVDPLDMFDGMLVLECLKRLMKDRVVADGEE